ncbi:Serine protease gd [Camponotus floridanus]|uniref:Serine protease gd n=1 Tax=Camponotus floridanus TaxID=104421 RepID=E2AEC9_CAMFO|nr:Serine protease gd [Camponotus floridanus]
MAKAILIVLLPQLLCTLLEVSGQQSPCPEYFTYILDSATNQVMGQIQILSPPKNVELHLKVALSIGVALPTNYVGQLKLAQSKEESVRLVERGKPLLYHLHFPLLQPIPSLTGMWFNRQRYCSGPRATGQVVTSITLEHTLYPPPVLPLSHNSYDDFPPDTIFNPFWSSQTTKRPPPPISYPSITQYPVYQPTTTKQPIYQFTTTQRPIYQPITQRPIYQPTTTQRPIYQSTTTRRTTKKPTVITQRPTFSDQINNNPFLRPPPVQQSYIYECGISNQPITNNINPLISKGMKTSPGQWPWLVALFLVKIKFEFQCAGSILTQKHVITAAHCFKLDAQTNIPPSAMLASLGRYRLQEWHEAGSLNIEIASYTLHPDYNHGGSGDSDLAILTLRTPVEFSPRIKPICMWYDSIDLQSVVDKAGYVVGWGKDELGHPYVQEPRMAKVPIVSQESCLWSDQRFVSFTSNRTFCAGMRDGSGPCNGDSGSGLMLYDSSTGRYQLRGIVSRSLFDYNEQTCDLTQYVVFVDVAKYLSWIYQQISM